MTEILNEISELRDEASFITEEIRYNKQLQDTADSIVNEIRRNIDSAYDLAKKTGQKVDFEYQDIRHITTCLKLAEFELRIKALENKEEIKLT